MPLYYDINIALENARITTTKQERTNGTRNKTITLSNLIPTIPRVLVYHVITTTILSDTWYNAQSLDAELQTHGPQLSLTFSDCPLYSATNHRLKNMLGQTYTPADQKKKTYTPFLQGLATEGL